jgi:twitching motility protein PilT
MNREQFMAMLAFGVRAGASDIHFEVGYPPTFRIRGDLVRAKAEKLKPDDTMSLAKQILVNDDSFFAGLKHEVDRGFGVEGVARFRASVFRQRGSVGVVLRIIPLSVPSMVELGMPPVVESVAWMRDGMVLVTGPTGNGKSTTIASLLDYMNHSARLHIVTVEDPIEYVYTPDKSVLIQREVGVDTDSYAAALRAAVRQDPDVIMVGEMRDYETADTCLKAAETGHLIVTSLHTPDVQRTIGRFVGIFTSEEQVPVRNRLADILKAIVSLRLVPKIDGNGMVAAVEVLLTTAPIQDAIRDPTRIGELQNLMQAGKDDVGMQTFDQHLIELVREGMISRETALRSSTVRSYVDRELKMRAQHG